MYICVWWTRLFFGKTKVMAKALGTTVEEEYQANLSSLAKVCIWITINLDDDHQLRERLVSDRQCRFVLHVSITGRSIGFLLDVRPG